MMKRKEETFMPTKWGDFQMIAYASGKDYSPHFAIANLDFDPSQPVLVRFHSECITGDLFGSNRCDCGEQLDFSLKKINSEGGVVIYLRQEGRGIGILNKMKAYNLQDTGLNTKEANLALGFGADDRKYEEAIEILKDLGISKVRLMTNNPEKIKMFDDLEIELVERVPILINPRTENLDYLITKQTQMGHLLNLKENKAS